MSRAEGSCDQCGAAEPQRVQRRPAWRFAGAGRARASRRRAGLGLGTQESRSSAKAACALAATGCARLTEQRALRRAGGDFPGSTPACSTRNLRRYRRRAPPVAGCGQGQHQLVEQLPGLAAAGRSSAPPGRWAVGSRTSQARGAGAFRRFPEAELGRRRAGLDQQACRRRRSRGRAANTARALEHGRKDEDRPEGVPRLL